MDERNSRDEIIENIDEIIDPQVTSSDPNERKLARKLRIERRIGASKRRVSKGTALMEAAADFTDINAEKTLLDQQLERSAKVIEMLLLDSEEHITNIRVANDSREVDRRESAGVGREKIFEKLEEEAASATEIFDRIADRWLEILKYNDPLLINDELINQKARCDELIVQKDGVIVLLKEELIVADKMFYDDQKKQNEDIHVLAKRIEKQVQLVRKAYRQESSFIENVVSIERQMMIDSNDKKWEEFYKRRDVEEKSNVERKFQQLEEFDEEITKLTIEHQEIFRETKINLENDIEDLQKEFEQIKAVGLINSEKMDYNYQILRKREDENIIMKSQQKRKINKLQDYTNDLRKKIREYETSAAAQILKLTDEVFALQKCVLEQETKSESMAKGNDQKYRQVWDLNTKGNTKLLDKILTIDQLIYDQLLGLPWKKPTKQLWKKDDLQSYRFAIQQQNMYAASSNMKAISSANRSEQKLSHESAKQQERINLKRLLNNILDQVSSKSGFLVEYRLKHILDPYSYEEHVLVRIDNIFAALGIKEKEDLDSIVDYFIPYTYCPICVKQSTPISMMMSLRSLQPSVMSKKFDGDQSAQSSKSSAGSRDSEGSENELTESEAAVNVLGDISQAVRQPDYVIIDTLRQLIYSGSKAAMAIENVEAVDIEDDDLQDADLQEENIDKVQSSKKSTMFKLTCKHRHPLIMNSMYVLRALREFINNHFTNQNAKNATAEQYTSVSRELQSMEVQEFWRRFKIIFAEEKENLWDGLLEGLKKYHAILLDREKIYNELLNQRKENEKLKALCVRYQTGKEVRAPCAAQRFQPYLDSPVHGPTKPGRSKMIQAKESSTRLQSLGVPIPIKVDKPMICGTTGTDKKDKGKDVVLKAKSGGNDVKKIISK